MKRWVLALTLLTAACREPVIRDIDGFFRKPLDLKELTGRAAELLRGSSARRKSVRAER